MTKAKAAVPVARTVILVPRRDGDAQRDAVWAYVRRWWQENLPEYPIYEGHHEDGLFNRSAAVNRAAGHADWQAEHPWTTAIIIDSDVLPDPTLVRGAVIEAQLSNRMVLPFDVRRDLSQTGSRKVMAGHRGSWDRLVHRTYTSMVSGVVVVSRRLWDDVGGFDEGFVGWGFEDNAFAAACEVLGGGPVHKMHGDLWHLWHPTATEGKRGTAVHARNRGRAQLYLEAKAAHDGARIRELRSLAAPAYRPGDSIPRILHRTVPAQPSAQVERWWREWGAMHPRWQLMDHRDPLEPALWPETSDLWPQCKNGAELADLVRLEALWRWGGVYVDSDVEPWRSLEPLLALPAFAAWEDERVVPNAVMGAVPGHPAIRACLDLARERIALPTWERGPGVTTKLLVGRDDVLLLPPGSFYPVHYRDPERTKLMRDPATKARNPWAFGLHHYHGSWLAADKRHTHGPVTE